MNLTQIIVLIGYILCMTVAFFLFKPKKVVAHKQAPKNSYDALMNILADTITRELKYQDELEYKLKNISLIYDFKADLEKIVKSIMNSFSAEYLEELQYYHSLAYITRIVTRNTEMYLIAYTEKHKIRTK